MTSGTAVAIWLNHGFVLIGAFARPLRTFPAWAPVRSLDSIYVRGDLELVALDRPRTQRTRMASDHLPLVAELRLLPP